MLSLRREQQSSKGSKRIKAYIYRTFMRNFILLVCLFAFSNLILAQYPGPVGTAGTTAIFKDSSVFVAWASGCKVTRGYQDVSDTSLGLVTVGDSSMAVGVAGTNGVVSLGDGGSAILTFKNSIVNGAGFDFAVFENAFNDVFLELAFVEVSSDGVNFVRFPATSNTQYDIQIGPFDTTIDVTKINNLAGKYRALYGTPFDLQELVDSPFLNVNAITHVKIIDVVGSINPSYASYDNFNKPINDPFPTPFASSGFDLDAIGVIHQLPTSIEDSEISASFSIFPNPASDIVYIENSEAGALQLYNHLGQQVKRQELKILYNEINISNFSRGVYSFQAIFEKGKIEAGKLIIQ
jgi:hypothetical protein